MFEMHNVIGLGEPLGPWNSTAPSTKLFVSIVKLNGFLKSGFEISDHLSGGIYTPIVFKNSLLRSLLAPF